MNEAQAAAGIASAGTLIRAERERLGLRLDALATTLKVSVLKLQALEHDRYDELPDAAFTRALAMSVCRVMGVDSAPVLALLPRTDGLPEALEHVTTGLRAPFDARASHGWVGHSVPARRSPLLMAAGVVIVMALIAGLLWSSWPLLQFGAREPLTSATAAASASSAASSSPSTSPQRTAPSAASSALQGQAASGTGLTPPTAEGRGRFLEAAARGGVASPHASAVRVTAPTWVELRDGYGRTLWARTLVAGESAPIEGGRPLRLVVGNANSAIVVFNGQPVDLRPWTRDNMASIEIK